MIRVGIIGCGQMGALHARTLKSFPEVELVAVCNHTRPKAEQLAAELGATAWTDHQAMLEKARLDAVWIATPDFAHVDVTLAALAAGAHVFVEKALATTIEDGATIVRAAAAHPRQKAMIGYPLPWDPVYREMKRVLAEPDAGRAMLAWSIRTHFLSETQTVYDKYRDEHYRPPAWYFDAERGKGPIFSHASHDYQLLEWLCGPIRSVYVRGGTFLLQSGDVADGFVVTAQFADGAVATISTPWVTRVEYDFVGVAAQNVTVANTNGELRVGRAGEPEQSIRYRENTMWTAMNGHFLRCIAEDRTPEFSLQDGLRAITIAQAAYESLQSGRETLVAEGAGA
ncbi:MAG TPA: Gfo/Idh/MocA family oxidoreductase [Limnochordia bacterium]|nr:Gfo/Idh/MocA family oxidoreductase [Limnochordia bacterium]